MNESIETKIELIESDIAAAYDEAESKGATMPQVQGSANLADAVASIPTGTAPTLITKQITANGTYTAEDDGADGYSDVTIDVPDQSKNTLNSLIDRTITTITSDVTSIGDGAFNRSASLKEANFPNVTSIGVAAFYNCTSLTEVNFPKVTSIMEGAFNGCTALTKADFPEATSIGTNAFQYCTSLKEANFPNVTSIGVTAFRFCAALTEVNFPNVTSIESSAFQNCKSIKYFDMSEVAGVPTISSNTFNDTTCIFLFRDQTQLNEYASATNWSALADRFQIKEATP